MVTIKVVQGDGSCRRLRGMVTQKKLRVGTRVSFPYGTREIEAEVIENRGPLGVGGRQIVRVRFWDDFGAGEGQDKTFEMPADELTPVTAVRPRRRSSAPK